MRIPAWITIVKIGREQFAACRVLGASEEYGNAALLYLEDANWDERI
jgi:hypothetical protein